MKTHGGCIGRRSCKVVLSVGIGVCVCVPRRRPRLSVGEWQSALHLKSCCSDRREPLSVGARLRPAGWDAGQLRRPKGWTTCDGQTRQIFLDHTVVQGGCFFSADGPLHVVTQGPTQLLGTWDPALAGRWWKGGETVEETRWLCCESCGLCPRCPPCVGEVGSHGPPAAREAGTRQFSCCCGTVLCHRTFCAMQTFDICAARAVATASW